MRIVVLDFAKNRVAVWSLAPTKRCLARFETDMNMRGATLQQLEELRTCVIEELDANPKAG